MTLTLVTPPADPCISLAEAKAHLRVDHSDEDALILGYVEAAQSLCEGVLKMSLMPTVWEYRIDGGFPWEIRLPIGPVLDAAAVSITYVDDAGDAQTLAATEYQVSTGETGIIRPAYAKTWPPTRPIMDAVSVRFTAGYERPADIPRAVLHALKLTLGDFYENRENATVGVVAAEVPLGARNLLTPYVRHG